MEIYPFQEWITHHSLPLSLKSFVYLKNKKHNHKKTTMKLTSEELDFTVTQQANLSLAVPASYMSTR